MMTNNPTPGRRPQRQSQSRDVHTITDARESHTADMNGRMLRYALSMGIRLVCIVLAFAFDGWVRWVAIAGAVLLPWIAVVIANAGGATDVAPSNSTMAEPMRPALTRGPEPEEVLDGQIVDDAEPGDHPGPGGGPHGPGHPAGATPADPTGRPDRGDVDGTPDVTAHGDGDGHRERPGDAS